MSSPVRALVLIDLQRDFLARPGLIPAAGALLATVAGVLQRFREAGRPVFHVRTLERSDGDDAMPHRRGRPRCVAGTTGAEAPPELAPRSGESVVTKRFYSAFEDGSLEAGLRAARVEELVVCGLHLHACVRASVLDAYARGFRVCVVDDGVASAEPLHAELSRAWLAARAARFVPARRLEEEDVPEAVRRLPAAGVRATEAESPRAFLHRSPRDGSPRFLVPACPENALAALARSAQRAAAGWAGSSFAARRALLVRWSQAIEARRPALVERLVLDLGKPLALAERELAIARARLARLAALPPPEELRSAAGRARRVPHGVVGLVTPWNHPIALAVGKLAPALLYGNAALWKPALPGAELALTLVELLAEAGAPDGLVGLVQGDADSARALMERPELGALSLTGAPAAGTAAQAIAARGFLPLQAELGGNNAALVDETADLAAAARAIVRGAFRFAGQGCTANRRAVVVASALPAFLAHVAAETRTLVWGDPLTPGVELGPLISTSARDRFAALLARGGGEPLDCAPAWTGSAAHRAAGAYHPPAVRVCADPSSELVQEESFAPMLVVQPAADFDAGLALSEAVRQGLCAALFSSDPARWPRFRRAVRAGVLKWNRATAGTDAELPFGGWKSSGVGPPERGDGDLWTYTRLQVEGGGPG